MATLRAAVRERGFWAGVLFLCCGLFFMVFAQRYPIGTAADMGAGYFPAVVGGLLALLGIVRMTLASLRPEGAVSGLEWRPLVFVIGSVLFFGFAVRTLGIVLATAIVVGLTSLAAKGARPGEVALLALGMVVVAAIGFVYGLGVALPLWPAF